MRTQILSYDEMKNYVGESKGELWLYDSIDNQALMKKAALVIADAITTELTPRQRDCIEMYFYQNLKEREIGDILGIDKSTVSRHIKRGKARLFKCVKYACFESKTFHSEG